MSGAVGEGAGAYGGVINHARSPAATAGVDLGTHLSQSGPTKVVRPERQGGPHQRKREVWICGLVYWAKSDVK